MFAKQASELVWPLFRHEVTGPSQQLEPSAADPLGELGVYLISDGDRRPYRLKLRTPSFSNVSALPYVLRNTYVSDMIAILGSFFFVLGDIDR